VYRLLIVDDEVVIANGIKASVDWSRIGIVSVHVAYNLKEARDCLNDLPIDIIISDIEMPQESGFELLEWVRQHYPRTECMFLTCHADFAYAKRAIQLGSLEYMLKPVSSIEMEKVVLKAIEKIKISRESEVASETYKHYYRLWETHQPLLIERFWMDILSQIIPADLPSIMKVVRNRCIPYTEEQLHLPILISVQRWNKKLTVRDEMILDYALRNALEEVLSPSISPGQIVQVKKGVLLAIVPIMDGDTAVSIELIRTKCQTYIDACNSYFYCHLACYIGRPVRIHEMLEMYQRLELMQVNNVNSTNEVILHEDNAKPTCSIKLPQLDVWSELLKQGDQVRLLAETRDFLHVWQTLEGLDAKRLQQFYQNFLQMVLYTLKETGLLADEIFHDHLAPERALTATRRVVDLQDWVEEVLEKAVAHIRGLETHESVVEKIKRYIALHLDQELSRQYIADHVSLSPDYIVRLFKKEIGVSITDYILQERVKRAQDLLAKTDMTIGSIAASVGYSNFSYFSLIFKKESLMSPHDYRKQYRRKPLDGRSCS